MQPTVVHVPANQPQHPSVAQGGPVQPDETGYRGNHPVAAFFHVAFKASALLVYIFGGLFSMAFVTLFITVTLLLAADFWVTKNVTGRLMVALRWWNKINDDGTSEWMFESSPAADRVNSFDSYFFWVVVYGFTAGWIALTIFSITSPTNLPLTILGAILCGANALGFTRCSRDAKDKMKGFVMRQAMSNPGLVTQAMSI
jgi:hypothetical protein